MVKRFTHDNILLIHEKMTKFKFVTDKKSYVTLTLDMEKVNDKIE